MARPNQPQEPGPRRARCLLVGCTTILVLGIVMLGGGYLIAGRIVKRLAENWTSDLPLDLPEEEASQFEIRSLFARVENFRKGLEQGNGAEPLVLSSRDINILIQHHPQFRELAGKLYVRIDGNQLNGEVSIPLRQIKTPMPIAGDRYLIGSAVFRVSFGSGQPGIFLESMEVNHRKIPEILLRSVKNRNLLENTDRAEQVNEFFQKLEAIEIRDGKLIVQGKRK